MKKDQFDIQYRISRENKEEIKQIKKIDEYNKNVSPAGWISITIGDYEYGFIQNDDSLDGFELLDKWFKSFKDVVIELSKVPKVVLNYWDEPDEFFEFERVCNDIHIKYYNRIYPVIDGHIKITTVYSIKMIAETLISEKDFIRIIKTRGNAFYSEIYTLNPILREYVKKFKML